MYIIIYIRIFINYTAIFTREKLKKMKKNQPYTRTRDRERVRAREKGGGDSHRTFYVTEVYTTRVIDHDVTTRRGVKTIRTQYTHDDGSNKTKKKNKNNNIIITTI